MSVQRILVVLGLVTLSSCANILPLPPRPSEGHLNDAVKPGGVAPPAPYKGRVPSVVGDTAFLPPPKSNTRLPRVPGAGEKYTVVVSDVPVKELLFALARDAKVNVDIDPGIDGLVTLNAVNQTLPQILDRVSRQNGLRYELRGSNLIVGPDKPILRTYKVDYVNMSRDTTGTIALSTQVEGADTGGAGGGGGGGSGSGGQNTSNLKVTDTTNNRFWETLVRNVQSIIGEQGGQGGPGQLSTGSVIASPEAGLLSVKATSRQHDEIHQFLNRVMNNAQRQVLVEATVVEVNLNDQHQAGIDWQMIARGVGSPEGGGQGLSFSSNLTQGTTALQNGVGLNSFVLSYFNPSIAGAQLATALRLLREFGDTKVLSSPKLMALNNQPAVLKVVENRVYFTIQSQQSLAALGGNTLATAQTTPHTVPVGFVMSVTPQIDEASQVTLTVRPTLSRIIGTVRDPAVQFLRTQGGAAIDNLIPEIAVREMESVLKVPSGQTAVLGGLMQDTIIKQTNSTPGLASLPLFGELFKARSGNFQKSELVVFLRPTVIRTGQMNSEMAGYRNYLDDSRVPQGWSAP